MSDNIKDTNDFEVPLDSCVTVNSKVQPLTEQTPVKPDAIKCGDVFVKMPVLLAKVNLTVPVEVTITLDREAIEIKRIKKNVYLIQSNIIPFSQDNYKSNGILFISGFIRKNIEYATKGCNIKGSSSICGVIRHCTVEIPFNFTTRINFIREPIFDENIISREVEFSLEKLNDCDSCDDFITGKNPCEDSTHFTEFFNEKPFTELVRADITEVDIKINQEVNCKSSTEQSFNKFTEKIVLNLILNVLQKQEVKLTAL